MSSNLQPIGRTIASMRAARGLSQRELAALCGIRPNTVATIESGARSARFKNILKLAEKLDLIPMTVDESRAQAIEAYFKSAGG